MNAHAEVIPLRNVVSGAAPRAKAEHISLEADPEVTGALQLQRKRKTQASFSLRSSLRGCSTDIALLEDHYVQVRSERPGVALREYSFDLRFADPKPVRVRRIAWAWLIATVVGVVSFATAGWLVAAGHIAASSPAIIIACAGVLLAVASTLLCIRGTTESLQFRSAHGGAILLSVTGGIGSAKHGKAFFVALIKNINAAKIARAQPKQQLLRDEMREHHRLRELAVLSEMEYEASKALILKAHS